MTCNIAKYIIEIECKGQMVYLRQSARRGRDVLSNKRVVSRESVTPPGNGSFKRAFQIPPGMMSDSAPVIDPTATFDHTICAPLVALPVYLPFTYNMET